MVNFNFAHVESRGTGASRVGPELATCWMKTARPAQLYPSPSDARERPTRAGVEGGSA